MLAPVLQRCDREGVPAYLEASTVRNRALYERQGFAVTEEFVLGRGAPTQWHMWREPRRDAAGSPDSLSLTSRTPVDSVPGERGLRGGGARVDDDVCTGRTTRRSKRLSSGVAPGGAHMPDGRRAEGCQHEWRQT